MFVWRSTILQVYISIVSIHIVGKKKKYAKIE